MEDDQKLIQEIVLGERKFLHDLSNQLVVGQGMGSFVVRSLKKMENVDPKVIERAEKVVKACNQMAEMLKERRSFLHSQSNDKN